MATNESRSIYSGPVRRALGRLDKAVDALKSDGGGGTGTDEVWVGPSDPISAHPTIELWYDTDAEAPGPPQAVDLSYVHIQGTSAATWVVAHNLGWYPNVTVEDSGGTTVEGEIAHDSVNQLTLNFSAAFAGTAYLS